MSGVQAKNEVAIWVRPSPPLLRCLASSKAEATSTNICEDASVLYYLPEAGPKSPAHCGAGTAGHVDDSPESLLQKNGLRPGRHHHNHAAEAGLWFVDGSASSRVAFRGCRWDDLILPSATHKTQFFTLPCDLHHNRTKLAL